MPPPRPLRVSDEADPSMQRFRRQLKEKGWNNRIIQPSSTRVKDPWSAAQDVAKSGSKSKSKNRQQRQDHRKKQREHGSRGRAVLSVATSSSSSSSSLSSASGQSTGATARAHTSPSLSLSTSTAVVRRRLALNDDGDSRWGDGELRLQTQLTRASISPKHHSLPSVDLTSIDATVPAGAAWKEAGRLLKTGPHRIGEDARLRCMLRDAKSYLTAARQLHLEITEQARASGRGTKKLSHATERALQACFGVLDACRREAARREFVVAERQRAAENWRADSMALMSRLAQDIGNAQHVVHCNTVVGHCTRDIATDPRVRASEQRALHGFELLRKVIRASVTPFDGSAELSSSGSSENKFSARDASSDSNGSQAQREHIFDFSPEFTREGETVDAARLNFAFQNFEELLKTTQAAGVSFANTVERTVAALVAAEARRRADLTAGTAKVRAMQHFVVGAIVSLQENVQNPKNPALLEIGQVADITFAMAAASTTRRLLDSAMRERIDTLDELAVKRAIERRRQCLSDCQDANETLKTMYEKHTSKLQQEYNARVAAEAQLKAKAAERHSSDQTYFDAVANECTTGAAYGLDKDTLLIARQSHFLEALRESREVAGSSANLLNATTFAEYEISVARSAEVLAHARIELERELLQAKMRCLASTEARFKVDYDTAESRHETIRSVLNVNEHSIASNLQLVSLANDLEVALKETRGLFTDSIVAERKEKERIRRKQLGEPAFDPAAALLAQKQKREQMQRKKMRCRERRRARKQAELLDGKSCRSGTLEGQEQQNLLLEDGASSGTAAIALADTEGTLCRDPNSDIIERGSSDEDSLSVSSDDDETVDRYGGHIDVGAEFQTLLDDLSAAVEALSLSSKIAVAKTKRVQKELERGWSKRAGRDEALRDRLMVDVLRPANDQLFRLAGVVEFFSPGHKNPEGLRTRFTTAQRAIRAALDAALQPAIIVNDEQLSRDLAKLESMVTAAGDLSTSFQQEVDALREACIKRDQALDQQRLTLIAGPLKEAQKILERLDQACTLSARQAHLDSESEAVAERRAMCSEAVVARDSAIDLTMLQAQSRKKLDAQCAKRAAEAAAREEAARQATKLAKREQEAAAAARLERERAVALLARTKRISMQRALARIEKEEQAAAAEGRAKREAELAAKRDADFSIEALAIAAREKQEHQSAVALAKAQADKEFEQAKGEWETRHESPSELGLVTTDGQSISQKLPPNQSGEATNGECGLVKSPNHDPLLEFEFPDRVHAHVQAEAVSELILGQAEILQTPLLKVLLDKAHEAHRLAHARFDVDTSALSQVTAEKEAAIRVELASSAYEDAKRVEELSRACDVFALRRLLDERHQFVRNDPHWAAHWVPITHRLEVMSKAVDILEMAVVQEVPLTWEEREAQGVVPAAVSSLAKKIERWSGCLGSAELNAQNNSVYAQVLTGCAFVAAEQDRLADHFVSRSVHFQVVTDRIRSQLEVFRVDRIEKARRLLDHSQHGGVARQEVSAIEYGFESLPGMLTALEADIASHGPLTSDAATRDFLEDCQARCDRLDGSTAAFLRLCQETEARLETAYRRRVAKQLLERRELGRIAKGAALKVRDSRKLLRKVDKSGALKDPYTLQGRVPSRVAAVVENDRVDIERRNHTTLERIDVLLGAREMAHAQGTNGGASESLVLPIDASTEDHTQSVLERLTDAALSSVVDARKTDADTRQLALKVLDTKDVLGMVRPTLAQALGQTVHGDVREDTSRRSSETKSRAKLL